MRVDQPYAQLRSLREQEAQPQPVTVDHQKPGADHQSMINDRSSGCFRLLITVLMREASVTTRQPDHFTPRDRVDENNTRRVSLIAHTIARTARGLACRAGDVLERP